eukprot:g3256.t1
MMYTISRRLNTKLSYRFSTKVSRSTSLTPPHPSLRKDVKFLGWALGTSVRESSESGSEIAYETVEKIRLLTKDWRQNGKDKAKFDEIVKTCAEMPTDIVHKVARAFTHFLALANAAESRHRHRRSRERDVESGQLDVDSFTTYPIQPLNTTLGTIQRLLSSPSTRSLKPAPSGVGEARATVDEIYDALCSQNVEIVLTAHPTEVNRRTVVHRHKAIGKALEERDNPQLSWSEAKDVNEELRRQIRTLWETDEIRRERPTPVKEARHGLDLVQSSMWHAVPSALRRIDAELCATPGIEKPLPPDATLVNFCSWMGGDRDGNPNVTPAITKEVVQMSRIRGARLLEESLVNLRDDLSLSNSMATPELLNLLSSDFSSFSVSDESMKYQPYAHLCDVLSRQAASTGKMLQFGYFFFEEMDGSLQEEFGPNSVLSSKKDVLEPLMVAYNSLCSLGLQDVADGKLRDVIRQVNCFGIGLLPLDCRNESVRHSEALDAITRFLGIGSYLDWDEETRCSWLTKELAEKRPLLPRAVSYQSLGNMFNETVCDTLETFDAIRTIPPDSLRSYVISMCKSPSDVLAVRLLQMEAGITEPMRISPLFETLDDLDRAPNVMKALWENPWYKGDIGGKHEVMLGYSDSSKDAGRFAASWAQYQCQLALVSLSKTMNVDLTLFHGKGGTVSRGGDPSVFRAICAQPPGTVSGRFRITEQGEIITNNYASPAIAEKHLNTCFAALLYERFLPQEERKPTKEFSEAMDEMSRRSCDAYRKIVRETEEFVPYFRLATPELEIASLNVGSRPAKRRPTGGVETLRAIPWVFAWTQTRLNLTAWLGVGDALSAVNSSTEKESHVVKEMMKKWPWFTALIDVIDMVLSKTESEIAENYDAQLLPKSRDEESEKMKRLGKHLRNELSMTQERILSLRNYDYHQQENETLQQGLKVRNPYVDPLNVLQADVLRRLRSEDFQDEEEKRLLEDSLAICINGIANGQKNTG